MQVKRQTTDEKKSALFSYLLILTAFFILLEISFLIQCSGIYLGDFRLISSHLSIPDRIIPGVLYFVFAQALVHFTFILIVWASALCVGVARNFTSRQTEKFGIILWFIAMTTVFIANRFYFPNSKYSGIFFSPFHQHLTKYALIVCCLILFTIFAVAFYGLVRILLKHKRIGITVCVAASLILIGALIILNRPHPVVADAGTAEKPNIIIIGVDSLRPDFLSFFGDTLSTPHFDYFLNHATVFAESVTPIARTYPSWASILTGEYPKTNTVRTNLSDPAHLDLSMTIPAILRNHGYKTVFATDETRFSNIDQRFGFDEVATPPIGMNDFLLGTLNDFPLSNLILNTPIGKYLFPHSYGSRPVFFTYDPNSFLKLLQPKLAEPRDKPVFLVVHFCLTHYPYAWAELPEDKVTVHHYQAAIERVDDQFHDFMQMLKDNNLLQHSIVVLLSDHGEGVEMSGDRITDPNLFIAAKNNPKKIIPQFYAASAAHESVDRSGGHGTDVLGLSQYHTVLAVRSFGAQPNQKKTVTGLVSLLDIKPTLLQFLHLPLQKVDGYSLLPAIFGHESVIPARQDFFIESDFSPEAIRTVHPEMRKVLFEGLDYFRIDPTTTRVVVKDSMLKMIISSKQYADFYGPWILALYPQNNKTMAPILVNLETGEWTNALSTPFAQHSPALHMLQAMKQYYGNSLTSVTLQ